MPGIEGAKTGKLIYHLTQVDNFESIVKNGMLPRKSIKEKGIKFSNVADMNIIDKRTKLGLDAYTPFHFHPYSAFDVAVKNTYNAQRMIYMCIDRKVAKEWQFKVLPKHPLSSGENYALYDYDEGFNLIDWDTLTTKKLDTEYAKEVKMAECLTEKVIPLSLFSHIYVPSSEIEEEIIAIMDRLNVPKKDRPYVNILEVWFKC